MTLKGKIKKWRLLEAKMCHRRGIFGYIADFTLYLLHIAIITFAIFQVDMFDTLFFYKQISLCIWV